MTDKPKPATLRERFDRWMLGKPDKSKDFATLADMHDEALDQLDEMAGLLGPAECPNSCIAGAIQSMPDGEPEQCQWCFMKDAALARHEGRDE